MDYGWRKVRPDLVLWSSTLTVPWEDAVDEANERKKLRYSETAAEAEQQGWRAIVRPVEGWLPGTYRNICRQAD